MPQQPEPVQRGGIQTESPPNGISVCKVNIVAAFRKPQLDFVAHGLSLRY